jgi:hypothetical protein
MADPDFAVETALALILTDVLRALADQHLVDRETVISRLHDMTRTEAGENSPATQEILRQMAIAVSRSGNPFR